VIAAIIYFCVLSAGPPDCIRAQNLGACDLLMHRFHERNPGIATSCGTTLPGRNEEQET
jgi:hypothetical protein